jgi:hypothetical protein
MTTTQHTTHAVEFRIADEGDGRTITGIAVPYGEVSSMVPDPQGEKFLPGAFRRNVANMRQAGRWPKLFIGHNHERAVGKVLDMQDTDEGLTFAARLAGTPAGDAALLEVREGTLDSLSIGFVAIRERRGQRGVREVVEARAIELSLTPLGAYSGASVLSMRNAGGPLLPPMPRVDPGAGLRLPLTFPR